MPENNEVLSIDQMSAYLKVPKSTLYHLVNKSGIPGRKVGKHWRFNKEAVARWLDTNPGKSGT